MKRKLNNTELESIGKAIFKSEPLPAAEIDRIVSKSELFSLVQRRIQNTPAAAAPVQVRVLPHRRYVLAWSGMALTFAAAGALAVVNLSTKEEPKKAPAQIAVFNQVPEIAVPDTVAGLEVPPQPNTGKLSASPATKIERDVPRYEHAIVRTPATRRREEPVNAAPEKFYPVSYTGDPMETAVGGQVIRV